MDPRRESFDQDATSTELSSGKNLNGQVPTSGEATAIVVKVKPRPGLVAEFASWHARMFTAAAGVAGFISAEVNAPAPSGPPEWNIIQRFQSAADLRAWLGTQQHRHLLDEARLLVDETDPLALQEVEVAQAPGDGLVTEVVTTYVKSDKDHEYRQWAERVHGAEAQFPGYRGGFLQPPASSQQRYWTTLVKFATPEQLDAWLGSEIRRKLLSEHGAVVRSWEHHRLPDSFAAWFPRDPATGGSPSSWKQSMLVLLMLFPVVALQLHFIRPLLHGLNSVSATFVGNIISVSLLSWPLMPITVASMRWWLLPQKGASRRIDLVGTILILALYASELTVLSFLL